MCANVSQNLEVIVTLEDCLEIHCERGVCDWIVI